MVDQATEILTELEQQIQTFQFKSTLLSIDEWSGTCVIEKVYNREKFERFKSTEDRLLKRLELWIDVCRIEKIENNAKDTIVSTVQLRKVKKSKFRNSISLESISIHAAKTEIDEKAITANQEITFDNLTSKLSALQKRP